MGRDMWRMCFAREGIHLSVPWNDFWALFSLWLPERSRTADNMKALRLALLPVASAHAPASDTVDIHQFGRVRVVCIGVSLP